MTDQFDAVVLGAFAAAVLLGTWRMARRDVFYAGFLLFFLVYTFFAMIGYRFYPILSMLLNAYFGPDLYYSYFWFVAASFAAYFVAFRLLHRPLVGRTLFTVSYEHHEGHVWTGLAAVYVLTIWMAIELARIYSGIDYGSTPQIPSFAYAFAFKNSPFVILVLIAFVRGTTRTPLERTATWAVLAALGGIFLITALKSSNRIDLLALMIAIVWLEFAPSMLDVEWRLRIRWNRAFIVRVFFLSALGAVLWAGLAAVKNGRGPSGLDYVPQYASVLFNDYFAPAHILFGSMGFHYVHPWLVLRSNVANSLLLGGFLDVPYLQTEMGDMLLPGINTRSTGFAYYIFTEGYMALGRWGFIYNGLVPVVLIALLRRLGRTSDLHYNALVGAIAAMFFPTVARAGNHLFVRVFIFAFVPYLLLFRYMSGARLHDRGERATGA